MIRLDNNNDPLCKALILIILKSRITKHFFLLFISKRGFTHTLSLCNLRHWLTTCSSSSLLLLISQFPHLSLSLSRARVCLLASEFRLQTQLSQTHSAIYSLTSSLQLQSSSFVASIDYRQQQQHLCLITLIFFTFNFFFLVYNICYFLGFCILVWVFF